MSLTCPTCKKTLKTPNEIPAGKLVRCPGCQKTFPSPGGNGAVTAAPPAARKALAQSTVGAAAPNGSMPPVAKKKSAPPPEEELELHLEAIDDEELDAGSMLVEPLPRQIVLRAFVLVLAIAGAALFGFLGYRWFVGNHGQDVKNVLDLLKAVDAQKAEEVGRQVNREAIASYGLFLAAPLGLALGVLASVRRTRPKLAAIVLFALPVLLIVWEALAVRPIDLQTGSYHTNKLLGLIIFGLPFLVCAPLAFRVKSTGSPSALPRPMGSKITGGKKWLVPVAGAVVVLGVAAVAAFVWPGFLNSGLSPEDTRALQFVPAESTAMVGVTLADNKLIKDFLDENEKKFDPFFRTIHSVLIAGNFSKKVGCAVIRLNKDLDETTLKKMKEQMSPAEKLHGKEIFRIKAPAGQDQAQKAPKGRGWMGNMPDAIVYFPEPKMIVVAMVSDDEFGKLLKNTSPAVKSDLLTEFNKLRGNTIFQVALLDDDARKLIGSFDSLPEALGDIVKNAKLFASAIDLKNEGIKITLTLQCGSAKDADLGEKVLTGLKVTMLPMLEKMATGSKTGGSVAETAMADLKKSLEIKAVDDKITVTAAFSSKILEKAKEMAAGQQPKTNDPITKDPDTKPDTKPDKKDTKPDKKDTKPDKKDTKPDKKDTKPDTTKPDDKPDTKPDPLKPLPKVNITIRHKASAEKLTALGLALHTYHEANQQLPPPAIYSKEEGDDKKALLSWRVAILPYIGHKELYDKFNLDEPWDSRHNLRLVTQMPDVFAPPLGIKTKVPYSTYYQVFVGLGAVFNEERVDKNAPLGARGLKLTEISDGPRNTVGIIEGGESVVWTRPVDLKFDDDAALPRVGGMFKDGYHIVFMDGMCHFYAGMDEATLKALIPRATGTPRPKLDRFEH